MGNETIDVLCFVFPDGSTFFLPTSTFNEHDPRKVLEAWKAELSPDQRQRYEEAQVMGGFVWMHMLKEDYDRLPATSMSHRIAQRLEGGA